MPVSRATMLTNMRHSLQVPPSTGGLRHPPAPHLVAVAPPCEAEPKDRGGASTHGRRIVCVHVSPLRVAVAWGPGTDKVESVCCVSFIRLAAIPAGRLDPDHFCYS